MLLASLFGRFLVRFPAYYLPQVNMRENLLNGADGRFDEVMSIHRRVNWQVRT